MVVKVARAPHFGSPHAPHILAFPAHSIFSIHPGSPPYASASFFRRKEARTACKVRFGFDPPSILTFTPVLPPNTAHTHRARTRLSSNPPPAHHTSLPFPRSDVRIVSEPLPRALANINHEDRRHRRRASVRIGRGACGILPWPCPSLDQAP